MPSFFISKVLVLVSLNCIGPKLIFFRGRIVYLENTEFTETFIGIPLCNNSVFPSKISKISIIFINKLILLTLKYFILRMLN